MLVIQAPIPSAGEWSSPIITGQPPPPCSSFTLTLVSTRKAALFGGRIESGASDDLLIVELSRDTVVSTYYEYFSSKSAEQTNAEGFY